MSAPKGFERKIYQTFEIGNDGKEVVRDFKIVYGELTMPHGTNFDEIPPVHRPIRSESQVVAIPEIAEVSWHSADGRKHNISVPVRSLITDLSVFYGFRFFFVDDRLDVYLISAKVPKTSGYTDTVATKVFSK
ncbi:MAG TPA: hypothetical protein VGA09_20310 [Candidatus Binatia bacterium]